MSHPGMKASQGQKPPHSPTRSQGQNPPQSPTRSQGQNPPQSPQSPPRSLGQNPPQSPQSPTRSQGQNPPQSPQSLLRSQGQKTPQSPQSPPRSQGQKPPQSPQPPPRRKRASVKEFLFPGLQTTRTASTSDQSPQSPNATGARKKKFTFHSKTGQSVKLSDDGHGAERKKDSAPEDNDGIVFGSDSMAVNHLYQVELTKVLKGQQLQKGSHDTIRYDRNYRLSLGVVTKHPDQLGPIPAYPAGWAEAVVVWPHKVDFFGTPLMNEKTDFPDLVDPIQGTLVGLLLDVGHILHLYVNKQDKGAVAHLPGSLCYPFFGLNWPFQEITAQVPKEYETDLNAPILQYKWLLNWGRVEQRKKNREVQRRQKATEDPKEAGKLRVVLLSRKRKAVDR